jgi:hypothetical protein
MINDNSIRCDYLHLANEIEFYIELKGQNLEHALEQIKATILKLSSNPKKVAKISYIYVQEVPRHHLKYKITNLTSKKL